MTHLDEAQLHAYVDGELPDERREIERHLAECAACRERLEAARRLRERARTLLGASGPANTAAPPFEQVLRRAPVRRGKARTPTRVILAWAASLAVAVTAGWYARGILMARHAAPVTQLAQAPAVDARAPAQLARAQPGRAAATLPAAADAQRPSSTMVVASAAAGEAADTAGERANVGRAPAAAAEKAVAAAEPAAQAAPAAPAAARAARDVHLEAVTVAGAAGGWTTVSRAAAAERLGGPIATIPDLPSLGHAVSGTGRNAVVRTIQVLGPGETIEIYQRHAPARTPDTAARGALTAGVASLTVPWEGYSVTGTASVPTDSLRKLLARLSAP